MAGALHVLLIDNYDSYTYNLAHLIGAVTGQLPTVVTADAYESIEHYEKTTGKRVHVIVISPGPGDPNNQDDFLPLPASALQQKDIPVLGICLGMQAMVPKEWIRKGKQPAHGVVSRILLCNKNKNGEYNNIWKNIPIEFLATRYHSLVVSPPTDTRERGNVVVDAWTNDDGTEQVVMALHRTDKPQYGVQFHPESIASQHGKTIVENFLRIAADHRRALPGLVVNGSASTVATNGTANGVIGHGHTAAPYGNGQANGKGYGAAPEPVFYQMKHRKLECDLSSEQIFRALFDQRSTHSGCSSFWLDSSRCGDGAADGRYSILGDSTGPNSQIIEYDVMKNKVTVKSADGSHVSALDNVSIFDFLKAQLASRKVEKNDNTSAFPMCGGYVGYFGYELRAQLDGVISFRHHQTDSDIDSSDGGKVPDAFFIFSDRFILIDHVQNVKYAVELHKPDEGEELCDAWVDGVEETLDEYLSGKQLDELVRDIVQDELLTFELDRNREEYMDDIGVAMDYLSRGESYEICLTNRLRARVKHPIRPPLSVYTALRRENPAPYSAYLRVNPRLAVCCSSPERFLALKTPPTATKKKNGTHVGMEIESKPIKGTRARHANAAQDARAADELRKSQKDRRENLMIVDLVRNDLSRVCRLNTVRVPHLMRVESFASVHQLVSTVRGTLSTNKAGIDAVRASFPMGSMTGAPKVRTLDIIDTLEHSKRGIYSGTIGYLSLCGGMDFNVVIRTAVIRDTDIEIGVGGAIVALSDADEEFAEIITKGNPIMRALSIALTGQPKFNLNT